MGNCPAGVCATATVGASHAALAGAAPNSNHAATIDAVDPPCGPYVPSVIPEWRH